MKDEDKIFRLHFEKCLNFFSLMHVYYRKLPVLLVFLKVGDFMTINLVLGNIKT